MTGTLLLLLALFQTPALEKLPNPNPPAVKAAAEDIVQNIKDSSVRVQFRTGGQNYKEATSSGTVVLIQKDRFYVLTCAHGLYEQGQRMPSFIVQGSRNGGPTYKGKVVADDRQRDVAVLVVEAASHKFKVSPVCLKETYATPVEMIRCGHPFNKNRMILQGTTRKGLAYINGLSEAQAVSARPHAIQGDSGGGIFRKSDGKLIGVTVSSDNDVMMAATNKSIGYILDKAKIKVLVTR